MREPTGECRYNGDCEYRQPNNVDDNAERLEDLQSKAKLFIDANVHDGEDRRGCGTDWVKFDPDELQELVDDLLEYLLPE